MTIEINLTGKKAFVTGGTRGIGLEISKTLAKAGADVVMSYKHDHDAAKFACESIRAIAPKANIETIYGDLENADAASDVTDQALDVLGGEIDIFVANAAVGGYGDFSATDFKTWVTPVKANLFGHVAMLEQLAGKFRRGGSVVFISSGAGHDPLAGLSAYGVSKAAINQLAAILAQEWGPNGIRVNVVSPGHTSKVDIDYANLTDSQKDTVAGTALRRIGTSQDVANTVLFFVSDLSSFVTGQWVRVNGGRI